MVAEQALTAGYPGRSAAQKLGVKPGHRLGLIGADASWTLDGTPEDVSVRRDLRGRRDVTVVFTRSRHALASRANRYARATDDDAALWIAWPRRAAGHDSDVTEQCLRDLFLPLGLVDVKVAAIDHDWSGLKFVRPLELRSG